jgi:hypothetical protein
MTPEVSPTKIKSKAGKIPRNIIRPVLASSIFPSLALTALWVLMFFTISYPNMVPKITGIQAKWLNLYLILIYITISAIFCRLRKWSFFHKFGIWAQTNLVFIYTTIYFLRLNNDTFNFLGYSLESIFLTIPIGLLGFLINLNLFKKSTLKESYLVGVLILISLGTFSIVSLIEYNSGLISNNTILDLILKTPRYLWLALSAISIGFISSLNTGETNKKTIGLTGLGFGFFSIQFLYLLSILNFNYWYKSLMFLIFWDFLFGATRSIVLGEKTINYNSKLLISGLYHILLFASVFYFGNLLI